MSEATFPPDVAPTPHRKRSWWLGGVLTCLLLAAMLVVAYYLLLFKPGIQVTVQNAGSQPLGSVVLFVTGNSYNMGDLLPGNTAEATVKCTGDSHLEIEFADSAGETRRLDAGGFFQPGYRGTIRVTINDGVIQENEQDIQWWAN